MIVEQDWWRRFFQGVALDLWRQATPPEVTRQETDFVEKVFKLTHAANLLDVPCGNGRLALELAGRGHRVTGVDLSHDYISEARHNAARRNLAVELHEREMRDLPWQDTFDAAVCWGNSFGYLDDDGNREFLHAVARTLKPGGRFLLDYGCCAEAILPHFQERRWYQAGDIHLLVHNRHNLRLSRLETEFTFLRGGQVDTRSGTQRIYSFRELTGLLETAGFADAEGYQGMDLVPFRLGSPRLYLTARKA